MSVSLVNELINKYLRGQGTAVDAASKLPRILQEICSLVESKVGADYVDGFGAFSENISYDIDDVVRYDGLLYKFTVAHEGPWSDEDVVPTTVYDEAISHIQPGSSDIVWFTYQESHAAEILEAYNAGKICALKNGDDVYILLGVDIWSETDSDLSFANHSFSNSDGTQTFRVVQLSTRVGDEEVIEDWYVSTMSYKTGSEQDIEDGDVTKVPTCEAVHDYVNEIVGSIADILDVINGEEI